MPSDSDQAQLILSAGSDGGENPGGGRAPLDQSFSPTSPRAMPAPGAGTPPAQQEPYDEVSALKAVRRDAQSLIKPLEALVKLSPGDPDSLSELKRRITAIPSGEHFARALNELRGQCETLLQEAARARVEAFRRLEANFIRERRQKGDVVREAGTETWRIGHLELLVDRLGARARMLYNHQPVTPWTAIASDTAFGDLLAAAHHELDNSAVMVRGFADALWEAYLYLRRQGKAAQGMSTRVSLVEAYREVRVALVRQELRTGKPDRKLTQVDLPMWTFLYLMDLYRKTCNQFPENQHLLFETGSQEDHRKGLALVLNGLDPTSDYKSYCYIYASSSEAR